jgi:hypothetical protein
VQQNAGRVDGAAADGLSEADESRAQVGGESRFIGNGSEASADLGTEFVEQGAELKLGDARAELASERLARG